MKITLLITLTLIFLFNCKLSIAQNDYTHGHGALQVFGQSGFTASPQWVKVWIVFMLSSFLSALFFIRHHTIARWVIGCFIAGVIATVVANKLLNIAPLSGFIAIIHLLFWSPALYQLLSQRPFLGPRNYFSVWSGVITAVILFSFIFDLRDSAIYLRYFLL